MRRIWLAVGAVLGALLAGCPSNPPPACVTVDTSCAPGYVPTFDNVWNNTIQPTCGSTRSSCHSASGHMGGLTFSDEATAYSQLMAKSTTYDTRDRVVPGDPGCSLLIVRTDSAGESYQMPPGDPLPAVERCALVQWVAAGAPGPGAGSAQ